MSACCLILSAVRRFNCCKSPGEQYINLWYTCGFLGSLPYLMRTARFLFVMMNWGGIRPAVSSQLRCVWIWMRVLRCQCECVSICKYITPNKRGFVSGSSHQVYEQFSDISRTRQCSFMSFPAFLRAQSLPDVFLTT